MALPGLKYELERDDDAFYPPAPPAFRRYLRAHNVLPTPVFEALWLELLWDAMRASRGVVDVRLPSMTTAARRAATAAVDLSGGPVTLVVRFNPWSDKLAPPPGEARPSKHRAAVAAPVVVAPEPGRPTLKRTGAFLLRRGVPLQWLRWMVLPASPVARATEVLEPAPAGLSTQAALEYLLAAHKIPTIKAGAQRALLKEALGADIESVLPVAAHLLWVCRRHGMRVRT